MDVVACNLTRDNVQLMFHRNLTNEIAHTNRYRTDQGASVIKCWWLPRNLLVC